VCNAWARTLPISVFPAPAGAFDQQRFLEAQGEIENRLDARRRQIRARLSPSRTNSRVTILPRVIPLERAGYVYSASVVAAPRV
jgi:hypothetical protein